jgi:hypothetical protein
VHKFGGLGFDRNFRFEVRRRADRFVAVPAPTTVNKPCGVLPLVMVPGRLVSAIASCGT